MRIGIPQWCLAAAIAALALGNNSPGAENAAGVLPPVNQRFASADVTEEPSFQKHVSPLFGRLGCNGRSCHGSFQGRGDFRLSLFGYDFKADHDELLKGEPLRANAAKPLESLILVKPTDADLHEGGQRYKKGGWEYHVFRRWLEAGAKYSDQDVQKLVSLEVTPKEILFASAGQTAQLKAIAVWPNGTQEDVTCLCRFTTNSEQVAKINADGLVTATDMGDTHVVVSYDNAVIAVPVIRPVSNLAGAKYPQTPTPTKVDELVVQKLRKLGVVQSDLCTDAEFLRRVSLDLTGTLPTAAEVEQFLGDKASTKRADKIEQLLSTPAYAAWWTTKLCDFTGNNDTKLNNVTAGRGTASQFWYDWLYDRVSKNEPYDKIAEGVIVSSSRAPGESYTDYCEELSKISQKKDDATFADRPTMPYYWGRVNFRTTEERAIGFAYTFLGIRIQCAQCHKHPFDQWSKADFDAFEPFFARVNLNQNAPRDKDSQKEYEAMVAKLGVDTKLRNNDLRNAFTALLAKGETIPFPEIAPTPPGNSRQRPTEDKSAPVPPNAARVLGGEPVDLNKLADARTPLMDWLRSKDNPYFAKAFVNRVWANYFNVGIVNPPDDMSLANPPSNAPLLDHLAQGFFASSFDMKWVHREILNSRTYQLSWQTNETNAKDEKNFARSVPRRLPAEVAVDALTMAVSSDEKAATYLTNLTGRSIFLAGSSARANQGGNNTNSGFALQVFGRSIRESNCDCDRSMDASLLQTVYLQNDTSVLQAIEGGRGSWIEQVVKQEKTRLSDGSKVNSDDIGKELSRMKFRLDRARKEKNNKEQVRDIEKRIEELEKNANNNKEVANNPDALALEPTALVRQVYLRTVSRLPTPEEMARCTQFLADAESPAAGAKGLLWTLINTKEFIVNH